VKRSHEVEDYIAKLPDDRRAVMQELREILIAAAPEADEQIAYKMPALRIAGRFFMSYDAYKKHTSLFPWTDAMAAELGDEIKPYVSGKGTLRFERAEALPADLIRRIVEIRRRDFGGA
jgi:uncharacterized protein YdhG (YjbR/CyaY superfamily)